MYLDPRALLASELVASLRELAQNQKNRYGVTNVVCTLELMVLVAKKDMIPYSYWISQELILTVLF